MAYTVPHNWVAGDFLRASWLQITTTDLVDHEARIVTLEASGAGDVVGPSASVDSEIALFNSTTGKLIKRATTTGVLKATSGVLSAATLGTDYGNVVGQASSVDSEIALFSSTGGKTVKRATGTGYVKVTAGVMGTPAATVPLATDVSGDLPFANLTQGSALSVLGVAGNATADVASIAAASDFQVLRRSGTAVGFGAVDLSQAAAITGALPLANLPATLAQILKVSVALTDAQIKALPTTPISIASAAGAGFTIHPIWARLTIDATAGLYTNLNAAAAVTLRYNGAAFLSFLMSYLANDTLIVSGSTTGVTDLFGAAAKKYALFQPYYDTEDTDGWGFVPYVRTVGDGENKAVELAFDNAGSGNLTGGNAANTGAVVILYLVL